MTKHEKEYYLFLANIIKEQKRKQNGKLSFFPENTDGMRLDVESVVEAVSRNPKLQRELHERIKKAAVGKDLQLDEKELRKLVASASLKDIRPNFLKLLRRDINNVYRHLNRKWRRIPDEQRKKPSAESVVSERWVRLERNTSSNFERNFKELTRLHGSASSPMDLASSMVSFMSGVEKKQLSQMFNGMGIRSSKDLGILLEKWKREALTPSVKVERKRERVRSVEQIRGY